MTFAGMARKVAAHESAMPERWQELLGKSFQVLEVAERVCTDLTALGGGADTSGGWSGGACVLPQRHAARERDV